MARHAELRLALGRFGRQLGVAFQILDDVLDLIADAATTGKARGKDLSEGVYTLPVIYPLSLDIETWAPENLRYSHGGGAEVVAGRN